MEFAIARLPDKTHDFPILRLAQCFGNNIAGPVYFEGGERGEKFKLIIRYHEAEV